MAVNLSILRQALEDLEELSKTVIVGQHPDPQALSRVIEQETYKARDVIRDVIKLIEESTTLELLIDQGQE